jgi:hypothetical protein
VQDNATITCKLIEENNVKGKSDPEFFVSSKFCGLPFRKRTPPEID